MVLDQLPNHLGLTPLEVASGMVIGVDPTAEPLPSPRGDARTALENVLLEALQHDPCCVLFSGGRDSSAILALTTHLARREGLPEPVALTQRYPNDPDADESRWQELVIDHIGLESWERLIIDDELDVIGPIAIDLIKRHGPLKPEFAHLGIPAYRFATGGCVISGEGGDELFDGGRLAMARWQLGRVRRRPSRGNLTSLAFSIAPTPVRRRWQAKMLSERPDMLRWLKDEPRHEAMRASADLLAGQPLSWPAYVSWLHSERYMRLALRSGVVVAADEGTTKLDPLLDPRFLAALRRTRPLLGYPNRSAAYSELLGELLPAELLMRADKASFNGAILTTTGRDFIDEWDGSGLDPELVDADRLRAEWAKEYPDGGALALLQIAWIATNGVETAGPHA